MRKQRIAEIRAQEIFNGRGFPAVEVRISTSEGLEVAASGPSGISTSTHETLELRDGGKRLMGKGVLRAVENIEKIIAPALLDWDVTDQNGIDRAMIDLDGSKQKSRLGGNAITAVSLAVAKAGAAAQGTPLYRYLGGIKAVHLPVLCPNLISGSTTAGNELDFEDYLIVPHRFSTVGESLAASVEIFHELHDLLKKKYGPVPQITALAPPAKSNEEIFDILMKAIDNAGYAGKIGFGLDVASGLLYDAEARVYKMRDGDMTREKLIAYYEKLSQTYPILFIEDGLHEDDFEGFALMKKELDCIVVGDDLFASDSERLKKGIEAGAATAVLLKINQIGTITEALHTAQTAVNAGYDIVASVRSGETDDSAQVDFAVAAGAKLMKIGSPIRGEMITKYNRLLTIAKELGTHAIFRGREFQPRA